MNLKKGQPHTQKERRNLNCMTMRDLLTKKYARFFGKLYGVELHTQLLGSFFVRLKRKKECAQLYVCECTCEPTGMRV